MNKKYLIEHDASCKRILTDKQVIVNILQAVVPEYRNMPKTKIVKCLELDEKNNRYIKTLSNEDIDMGDNKIHYDILFTSKAPNSKERISMFINIEAQNSNNVTYPLITRAVYYASRLISRQKNKMFTKSKYGNIKKVYSIWICTSPKVEQRGSINLYELKEKHLLADYKENKAHYSLINILMLNLNLDCDLKKKNKNILDMLEILLVNTDKNLETKRKILQNDFDIILDDKEVSNMMTLAEGIEYRGILKGRQEGRQEGKKEQINRSLDAMLKLGYTSDDIFKMLGLPNEDRVLFNSLLKDRTIIKN